MPNPVVFEAIGKHTATVIFAHGLGDTAAGWSPLAQSLRSKYKHIKWVLPTAPTQPVSINMGMKMNSWFDIQVSHFNPIIEFTGLMLFRCWCWCGSQSLPPAELRADDDKGMLESVRTINSLITQETDAGLSSDRVRFTLSLSFSQVELTLYSVDFDRWI